MTINTGRDEAWSYVLITVMDGENVTHEDVAENTSVSERTARDVLTTMKGMGWLSDESRYYGPARYGAGEHLQ